MYEVYLLNDFMYRMEGNVLMPCRPQGLDKLFPELVWLTFKEQGDIVCRIQTPAKVLYNHPQFLWYLKDLQKRGINLTELYWTPKPIHFMEIEHDDES